MSNNPYRYELDLAEFAGTYIEFVQQWTRGDVKAWITANQDKLIDLLQRKVIALNVGHIKHPDHITAEALDDLDICVYEWFVAIVSRVVLDVGEDSRSYVQRAWERMEARAAERVTKRKGEQADGE